MFLALKHNNFPRQLRSDGNCPAHSPASFRSPEHPEPSYMILKTQSADRQNALHPADIILSTAFIIHSVPADYNKRKILFSIRKNIPLKLRDTAIGELTADNINRW